MEASDWPGVSEIYREGIEGGNATFETEVPSWEEWDAAHIESCRLVSSWIRTWWGGQLLLRCRDGRSTEGWLSTASMSSATLAAGVSGRRFSAPW